MALNIPPYEAQYDEFGQPLHPIAAAIHNSSFNPPATVDPTGMYTPVPQEMKTQPVQRMNSPSYPPINPSTIPLTPNQQAREALQPPNPNDPKYKNSTLRTILNSVAAGLTGASNPAAGIQLAKSLRDAKYNRAKRSYDVQYGKLEDTEKIEEQNRQDALRRSSEDRMLRSSESEAQARIAAEKARQQNADTTAQREKDYAANIASLNAQREAQEKKIKEQTDAMQKRDAALNSIMQEQDPTKKKVLQDQYNNMYYKPVTPTASNDPTTAAAIEDAKTNAAANNPNTGRLAQIRSNNSQLGRNIADNPEDDKAVDAFVKQAKANPDTWHDIYKEVPTKLKDKFVIATADGPVPPQLNNQQKVIATNAKTAINHANTVEQMINNPKIKDYIGPIAGRISDAGEIIGKSITNTPEEERMVQALQTMDKYLTLFEGASVAGNRPSWQLIKYLQGSSPQTKLDEGRIRGSLDSIRASAGNRLKGLYDASSSGQPVNKNITPKGNEIIK